MRLPILAHREEFIRLIREYPGEIVYGPTGSGKTTNVPLFLLEAGFGSKGLIGITEPRKILTIEVATHTASKINSICGEKIGYQIRHDKKISPATRIKFMTEGILLREMLADPDLLKYEVIMLDEVHEGSTNCLLIMGMLRALMVRRPDLKVIISSATIDAEKYSEYFGGIPLLQVEGRVHDVEITYREIAPWEEYTKEIAKIVAEIHQLGEPGGILVFLTGEHDITHTAALLEEMKLDIVVCPLYAQLAPEEQAKALRQYHNRKIILATNIAEAGITPIGIKYVVDTGLIKQHSFDPRTGFSILEIVKHSQAGCNQRAGRVGRTFPGKCIRLYSEADFLARPKFSMSEITRDSVASAVLFMKAMGINRPEDYPLLESPDLKHLESADKHLISLGALTNAKKITAKGREILSLPLEPHQACQVLAALKSGCAGAVIKIVSMISVGKSPFVTPPRNDIFAAALAYLAKKNFVKDESDHLTLLNVYDKWEEAGGILLPDKWYEDNWISKHVLQSAEKSVEQIQKILGKQYKKGVGGHELIAKALLTGLTNNLCKRGKSGHFAHILTGTRVSLHRNSDLYHEVHLMFSEDLITDSPEGGKVKACICTKIHDEWLPESMRKSLKKEKRDKKGNKF